MRFGRMLTIGAIGAGAYWMYKQYAGGGRTERKAKTVQPMTTTS